MEQQYNMRNPAVKRLMKEAQELKDPNEQYYAQPLEDNLFEWHFTIRGPAETEFDGGVYHGRIVLPPEYPMKPPSIILLTPQGRFELNTKICLSISGHHPESWRPSWSIRTALLAIIGFMPTHGDGAIGSLNYTVDERKLLARKSRDWKCKQCGSVTHLLKPVTEASKETEKEAKELASQIQFQGEKSKDPSAKSTTESQLEPLPSSTMTSQRDDVAAWSSSPPASTVATTVETRGAPPLPWHTGQMPLPPPLPWHTGQMPLPPGMTADMIAAMARVMPPFPHQFPHRQTDTTNGVTVPNLLPPWPFYAPTPTPQTVNNAQSFSTTTTAAQSAPGATAATAVEPQLRQRHAETVPAPEPRPVVRTPQTQTQLDYVSLTLVILCCLGIAIIMSRVGNIEKPF